VGPAVVSDLTVRAIIPSSSCAGTTTARRIALRAAARGLRALNAFPAMHKARSKNKGVANTAIITANTEIETRSIYALCFL
jgi:hypothetical protein